MLPSCECNDPERVCDYSFALQPLFFLSGRPQQNSNSHAIGAALAQWHMWLVSPARCPRHCTVAFRVRPQSARGANLEAASAATAPPAWGFRGLVECKTSATRGADHARENGPCHVGVKQQVTLSSQLRHGSRRDPPDRVGIPKAGSTTTAGARNTAYLSSNSEP